MSLYTPYQTYLYILLRWRYPNYRTPELLIVDRGYPKAAIRLIRDPLNTLVHVIPKYSCRARLTKGKALALSRSIS